MSSAANLPLPPRGPSPKLTGEKPQYRSFAQKLFRMRSFKAWWACLVDEGPGHFRNPVDWLLGRDLLTYLRSISLYSSNGAELDHRDWMHPEVIDLSSAPLAADGAFWFDYMADAGDGQMAMYSLAYLALGDLWKHEGKLSCATEGTFSTAERLPRGSFLFLGGDTAYHVADRGTLAQRFAGPFDWAQKDREREGTLGGHEAGAAAPMLFAIPGNHDYYDSLLGFNHLFRHNASAADTRPLVADFVRRQDSSFAVMKLPFAWWFWGLDTQNGRIDWRQKQFILDQLSEGTPNRLIVCTPEPTTVFHEVMRQATRPYKDLHLPRPFTTGQLPNDDQIHLDIAGDVHHYARHSLSDVPNYASVVSGGGGAFLHPTHTNIAGRPQPVQGSRETWPPAPVLYPSPEVACRETNLRLLCPWKIFRGGYVWLIGAICAAVIYFGATVAPHTRSLSTHVGRWIAPLTSPADEEALQTPPKRDLEVFQNMAPALVPPNMPAQEDDPITVTVAAAAGAPAPVPKPGPPAEGVAVAIIIAALAAVFGLSAKPKALARTQAVKLRRYIGVMGALALSATAIGFTFSILGGLHQAPEKHPFLSSLMLLAFALPLPAAWLWTSSYVATLPKQAKFRSISWMDYVPAWIALSHGVMSVVFGLVLYGVQAIGQTFSDWVFVFAFAFVGLGPAGLGWFQAGAHRKWHTRLAFAAMGLYLGLLQICIPLLLALDGSWLRAAVVIGWTLAVTAVAATWCSTCKRSRLIWLLWLLAGGVALLASIWGHTRHEVSFTRLTVTVFAGALFTCVWFGWYLASTLAWGGHNNEAGGAAHLDRHRHFIRFKLQADRLTGYVIGINKPGPDGKNLCPELVDVFQLVPRRPSSANRT
ncbi:MAG: hypothetical protein SF187_29735 [Deltaproteobacteria bacterium]|nr:hypothetical protein [Deltaproteobacteria bacterium]